MSKSLITITIPNWEKYNPRSDRANYSWFRMENGFFLDQCVFCLSDAEKLLFLFFLCEASKRNSNEFEINIAYAEALLQRKRGEILKQIISLTDSGLIETSLSRHDAGVEPSLLPATIRYDTIRNETNTLAHFDFESLYKKYPRKLGKAEGIKRCRREIRTEEDFNFLSTAIDRFAAFHREKATEEKFIPYFSTFMAAWRDWIDPETGSATSTAHEPFDIRKALHGQSEGVA